MTMELRATRVVGFALATMAAVVLAPAATAQNIHLAVEARDMMMNCPNGQMMCLVVTQGSLDDLKPGVSGTVTFTNKGSSAHELKMIPLAVADPAHKATGEDQAFASSDEDMNPGAVSTFNFTVPASATGAYLFCHVSGHEASGMWLASGEMKAKGTPLSPTMALLAILAAALLARRMPAPNP